MKKKTRISPRFSTDFPVFDTVAKKPSSFLDILHKTNRKHHVYNSAAELFKRSAIPVLKTKTLLFAMQYTQSHGCPVLFLQDILLFNFTFLKFMTQ